MSNSLFDSIENAINEILGSADSLLSFDLQDGHPSTKSSERDEDLTFVDDIVDALGDINLSNNAGSLVTTVINVLHDLKELYANAVTEAPSDPSVRLRDARGRVWARIGHHWVSGGKKQRTFDELRVERGPLVVAVEG